MPDRKSDARWQLLPNRRHILLYAQSRGCKDADIRRYSWSGSTVWLYSKKRDVWGWPLVWEVARECGIYGGCGNSDIAQIDPYKFFWPTEKPE